MSDVIFYDSFGGFSPSFIATKQAGGSHMHQSQLAEFLVQQGKEVAVFHQGPGVMDGDVPYFNAAHTQPCGHVKSLVLIGNSKLPDTCTWDRALALHVIDPRPVPHYFDHLRDKDILHVCVSEWQAQFFRNMGFRTHVIPVPIPDEWYGSSKSSQYQFSCTSSWNKGARETVDAWTPDMGHLWVGSPYSQPYDAERICHAKDNVHWLGVLSPRQRWINAMQVSGAIARVCTIGETFGVVDVAARAMGINCYTLCIGDIGALHEVGAKPFTDPAEWREAIRQNVRHPGGNAERFRLSRVLPQWLELL